MFFLGAYFRTSGNLYIAGYSNVSWGSPMRPYGGGGNDAFVAKLSSSGTLLWNTFLGGSGVDAALGIAVDDSGNIYVAGNSDVTWGSPVRAYTGGNDFFAAKLSSSGALTWHTFLGGVGSDDGRGIAVDGSGNVYVAGESYATWGSPVRPYYGSGRDAFAARLSSSGALTWNTFLGDSGDDRGRSLALDSGGNVYVGGYSNVTWGSPVRAYGGGTNDGFAAQLSSSGALLWNTFLGGSAVDAIGAIAIDGSGNVCVAGRSDATWGSPVRTYTAGSDAFAAKLSSAGSLLWNSFLGGSGSESAYDNMAVDGSGSIYVVGLGDATWGSPTRAYGGGTGDGFAAKLSSSGALIGSTFFGGPGEDAGLDIALDASGGVYVAGYSDATWGGPVRAYTAGFDAFAAEIALPNCGDAVTEGAEQCDDGNTTSGDCCAPDCTFEASTVVCRTSTEICDVPEMCTGTSATCPADSLSSSSVACRSSMGICDLAENCTGASAACPTDLKSTATCRATAGDCDIAENCDGIADDCPVDSYQSASETCRTSVGACDIQENCTGAQADCPIDVLAPSTQECRPPAGPCDAAETCSGAGTACPADSFAPPTTECRGAAGICDAAESCTGADSQCPADSFVPASQECRPIAGPCDLPEVCTGSSGDCPSDFFAAEATPCRSTAGQCDEPETCTGDGSDCPADAKTANTEVCRATTGTCDASEYCDGTENTCPIDSGAPACGISDFCCPDTCGAAEDPDCCNNSITFSNCQIKPSIAVGKPDKYRVSCSVLDATASTNGLHLDTDPLWLVIRDATTTPAACLEELLSPGPCIGDICDTGTFELESCSEDRDCRPCRQTGNGFLCKGKPRTPGISKVALKLLRDGSGRRYKLVMTGSTTDIQCSFASLPWSLGIVQGDDCGDVACTQIDGSRISCPGFP